MNDEGFNKGINAAINVATEFGKAAAIGIGAAATAFTAFATQSVKAFADYEQLIGGVETLFGESADIVQSYAEDAYKTANLSANQYMETITSFSASLLQGLGGDTEKAAEIGNLAVTDMADNANKMGTSIEAIQNAYQGFAKDNYTMLDNLKLGYGGTAGEMARLVNESGVLGESFQATAENVKDIPFDQLVLAIHAVQEEMGITGTTALEASETISGSWNTLSSAWTNVLTSLASGNQEFFDESVNALISSTGDFVDNVMGAVTNVLEGSAKLLSGLISEVPDMLQQFLPAILQGAETLLDSIISELPSIMGVLVDVLPMAVESILSMLPSVLQAGIDVLTELANGIVESLPTLIPIAVDAVLTFVDTLIDNVDKLLDGAIAIIESLGDGLVNAVQQQDFWDKVAQIVIKVVDLLVEYAPKLIGAAVELIAKLIEGLLSEESIAALGEALSAIGEYVYNGFLSIGEKLNKAGNNISYKIAEGMKEGKPYLTAVMDALTDLTSAKANETGINKARETGKKLSEAYGSGLEESAKNIDPVKIFGGIFDEKKASADEFLDKYFNLGEDSTEAFANGIEENSDKPQKAVEKMTKEMYNNAILAIKDYQNQVEYTIEGEIAMREALGSKYAELSKERIEQETKVRELRKKLADQGAKDVKSALKSEEDAIKAREKAEKDFYNNAKLAIEDYSTRTDSTLEGVKAMWEDLGKHYAEGSAEKVEINKNINKLMEQADKEYYDNAILAIKDYQNDVNYTIEGEIAMREKLFARYTELSKEKVDNDTAVNKLREQQIKDEYDAETKLFENRKTLGLTSIQEEIDFWTEMTTKYADNAKIMEQANDELLDSQKLLADEQDKLTQKITDTEKKYTDALASRTEAIANLFSLFDAYEANQTKEEAALEKAQEQHEKVTDALSDLKYERLQAIIAGEDLTNIEEKIKKKQEEVTEATIKLREAQEAASKSQTQIITENVQSQTVAMEEFENSLSILAGRVDKETLEALRSLGVGYAPILEQMTKSTDEELTALSEAIQGRLAQAGILAESELSGMLESTNAAIQELQNEFDLKAFGVIGENAAGEIVKGYSTEIAKMGDKIEAPTSKTFTSIIPQTVTKIGDKFKEYYESMATTGLNFFTSAINKLPEIIEKITSVVPEIVEKIGDKFTEYYEDFKEMGLSIGEQIADGIKEALADLDLSGTGEGEGDGGLVEGNPNPFASSYGPWAKVTSTLSGPAAGVAFAEYVASTVRAAAPVTVNQNIQSVPQSPSELADATAAAFQTARW